MTTLRRMPRSGASGASRSSSVHAYVAYCQPDAVCSMKRVSARRANANSCQNFVQTGNCQASVLDASMTVPADSSIQRVLIAPSVESGYCGEKRIISGPTVLVFQSVYSTVSRRFAGGHSDAGDCPALAIVNTSTTRARASRFMSADIFGTQRDYHLSHTAAFYALSTDHGRCGRLASAP